MENFNILWTGIFHARNVGSKMLFFVKILFFEHFSRWSKGPLKIFVTKFHGKFENFLVKIWIRKKVFVISKFLTILKILDFCNVEGYYLESISRDFLSCDNYFLDYFR